MKVHIEVKIIYTEAFVLNANKLLRACWPAFRYYNAKPDPGYFRDRLIMEDQGHGVFMAQLWKRSHGEWQMVVVEITVEPGVHIWI